MAEHQHDRHDHHDHENSGEHTVKDPVCGMGVGERLTEALRWVQGAVAERKVNAGQFARWVTAVYQFLVENESGTGAEALVKALIGEEHE